MSVTPPPPDFDLTLSSVSASAVVGNSTSPVILSIKGRNGFSGPVKIAMKGLPSGVAASPAQSFSMGSTSQSVTFAVSSSAPVGIFSITFGASSGTISHQAQLVLNTEPVVSVRTYQSGSVLYIESSGGDHMARIGMETAWGGSITEVSLDGTNYVNMHDTGREVQAAQFDGSTSPNWNPTQGGDFFDNGSPVLNQSITSESLYIKAQPNQWYPQDWGGGPGQPVLGDTYVEETVSLVPDHAFTFQLHIKVTHFGADQHNEAFQDFPAVYCNLGYDRFVAYNGTAPWTNDVLSFSTMPQLPQMSARQYTPEHWNAFVDSSDFGLTVFSPSSGFYPGGFAASGDPGPNGFGTNYFAPMIIYSFGPNSILEGDAYLVAGDYKHARQVIYDLRKRILKRDISVPLAVVDQPVSGANVSGTLTVSGWAVDDTAVSKVYVYLDAVRIGAASYGDSRPDVALTTLPQAPTNVGYHFSFDSRRFANGMHTVQVRVVDSTGNIGVLPSITVNVQNAL